MKNTSPYIFLIGVPLLLVACAHFIFDFNGLYGQDAHRYFQYTGELEEYFESGKPPGEFHWPVLYPLVGLLIESIFGVGRTLALQLLSALSLGIGGVYLHKILERDYGRRVFWFVLVFLIFCPQLAVASVLCMSDLFSMAWVILSWYFYFEYQRCGKIVLALSLSAMAALATTSRYPAFLLVVVPMVVVFCKMLEKRQWMAFVLPVVFVVFCLPELVLHQPFQSISGSYQLNHWSITNWLKSNFRTIDGVQHYRFINLIYITYPFWHPAYFFAGIGLALFAAFRFSYKKWSGALMVTIALYLLFIGGIEFQNRRFFIPVFPLILIAVNGLGVGVMVRFIPKIKLAAGLFLLLILEGGIANYYINPYVEMNRFERQLSNDLKKFEGGRLYVFYWDTALKSYSSDFEYHNLWSEMVRSAEEGDLVLFNKDELEEQWAGSRLMQNWNFLNSNHQMEEIEGWHNGWKLYEIQ